MKKDVDREWKRRRFDPVYREHYNKMRREYYARKKLDPEYMAKQREANRKRQQKHRKRKQDEINKRTGAKPGE